MRAITLALPLALGLALGAAPGRDAAAQGFGLDLATPEAGATAFATAWQAGDYALAWMALDPELRFRFNNALIRYNFAAIFPGGGDPDVAGDMFAAAGEHMRDYTRDGEASAMLVDTFGYFHGLMAATGAAGMAPFALAGTVPEPGETEAEAVLPGAGETLRLHLRRSPGGLWRVTGIESDRRDLPEIWRPQAAD